MVRLVAFATGVLVAVLAALTPLWLRLGHDALVPIAVAVLHGLGMKGLTQWVLAAGTRAGVTPQPADYVTLARAMIGSGCLGVVVAALAGHLTLPSWWLAAPATVALLLDAVDGPVARRTGSASAAGGRFDLECDAMFVLVLALGAALVHGPWVLLLGSLRYLFVLVAVVVPRLRAPLAFSQLRRVIGATQGVIMVVAVTPGVPDPVVIILLVITLALVLASFARDTVTLLRR